MKRILIVHQNMEIGGAETALLGLLNGFDYTKVDVTLFLYEHTGDFFKYLPKQVHILNEDPKYRAMVSHISAAAKNGYLLIAIIRLFVRFFSKLHKKNDGYIFKQKYHYYLLPFLPSIQGIYDMAISFNDPHFVLGKKVNAKVKLGWFHTDFSRIKIDESIEKKMWEMCDYVVTVSEECKRAFDKLHPYMKDRSIVIENVLSESLIQKRSLEKTVMNEMPSDGTIKLLSIGRFSRQKNFDNVPFICKAIREFNVDIKWYLIGYGGEESYIIERIKEAGMQEYVIVLGKKENPYPYLSACDFYIQPSRWEGKSVAVREAQILNKPVIITEYATSKSQLKDGVDGIIAPMDNQKCAEKIVQVIKNKELQKNIIENMKKNDYTNAVEIEKIYRILEDV